MILLPCGGLVDWMLICDKSDRWALKEKRQEWPYWRWHLITRVGNVLWQDTSRLSRHPWFEATCCSICNYVFSSLGRNKGKYSQTLSSCKSLCRQTVNCSGSCCSAVFQRNTLNGKESGHDWGAMNYKVSMWAVSTNENQRAIKGLDWEWAAELLNSRADNEYIHMWTEHVIFTMFQKPLLIEHCFETVFGPINLRHIQNVHVFETNGRKCVSGVSLKG